MSRAAEPENLMNLTNPMICISAFDIIMSLLVFSLVALLAVTVDMVVYRIRLRKDAQARENS